MPTLVDYDLLWIFNEIPKVTTKKTQRDKFQNTTYKSKWNSQRCSSNPQEGRKKETDGCSELNICVSPHPKVIRCDLILNLMVFGSGTFRRKLGLLVEPSR